MKPFFVSVWDDDCIISAGQKLQFARGVLAMNDRLFMKKEKKSKEGGRINKKYQENAS